jgi:ElaB/YqjD/DUF883 family membrane-anchored ribosome-binding protein
MKNLKDLKDNVKELTKTGTENFNDNLTKAYNTISDEIKTITDKLEDKEDKVVKAIKEKHNDLKKAVTGYKDATKEKAAEMRGKIIDQLEHLNKEIENYNKKHKK